MSETTTTATWFTKDDFARLTEELRGLREERSTEIAQRIAEARDEGDLKENGGYHAAREEQAKQEARIRLKRTKTRGASALWGAHSGTRGHA